MKNRILLHRTQGIILICGLVPAMAWGEGSTRTPADGVSFGSGNNGVNRVIRTNNGFTGIEATIDSLTFSMPTNEKGKYEVVNAAGNPVVDANGTAAVDLEVQPFVNANGRANGNKPSAYIGGLFPPVVNLGLNNGVPIRTQCDAGLQYEPTNYFGAPAGWSLFFYADPTHVTDASGTVVTRVEMNPRVINQSSPNDPNGKPWRSTSNPISGTMTLDARATGSAGFEYSPLGTIYLNFQRNGLAVANRVRWDVSAANPIAPWGDASQPPLQIFNPANYSTANVKRVTAMTRDNPYNSQLDGSRLTAVWSKAQVRPVGRNQRWQIVAQNVGADLPLTLSRNAVAPANVTLNRGDTAAQIVSKLVNTGVISAATVSTGLPSANALTDPTIAPTSANAVGNSWGGATGNYLVAYTYLNGQGETLTSPTSSLALVNGSNANIQINVPNRPAGATGTKLYMETASGSGVFKFVTDVATNSVTLSNTPLSTAPVAPLTNATWTPVSATINIEVTGPVNTEVKFASQGTLASGYALNETQSVFRTWVANDVNQSQTGYDAPRTGDLAFDQRIRGRAVPTKSRTIIQFSSDRVTNANLLTPAATGDARYAAETVSINLGTLAKPIGSAVE